MTTDLRQRVADSEAANLIAGGAANIRSASVTGVAHRLPWIDEVRTGPSVPVSAAQNGPDVAMHLDPLRLMAS